MKNILKHPLLSFLVILFFLCMFLPCLSITSSQEDVQKRVEADIRFLADDLLEGRGTPSRGLDGAAVYCAYQLRTAGWQPGNGGSYFQTYVVKSFPADKATYNISVNNINLEPKDYLFFPIGMDSQSTPVKYNLEFAGYGIFAPNKGANYYEHIDVKNKAVIAFLGAPWQISDSIHAYDRVAGKLTQVAIRGGACLVYVSEEFESPPDSPTSEEVRIMRNLAGVSAAFLPEFKGKPTAGLAPLLIITPRVFNKTFNKIFGGTYEDIKKKLTEQQPIEYVSNASMKIQISAQAEEGKASNVVAMLRGNDPSLKDEWIVLSAHYDHLGSNKISAIEDGIFNRADDNASGVAAVLEIARQLAAGPPPRRSVLILLTSGEEMGELGSAYYAKNPLVPFTKVIANINVDMEGRFEEKLYCTSTGSDELFYHVMNISKYYQITSYQDKDPKFRTVYYIDSYHFARFNVPFIEISTGMYADYHQPADEVKQIRFDKIPPIVKIMYRFVDNYAQGEKKPAFLRPDWFLTPQE